MKTKAVRLYGKDDLRLDEFELPELAEDAVIVKVVSDSVCMSTYKETKKGTDHVRVPDDIAENPIIIGHEFAGVIVASGEKMKDRYPAGTKVAAYPPGWNSEGDLGYGQRTIGGDSTYSYMAGKERIRWHLLPDDYRTFYETSATEPLFCVISGYNSMVHQEEGSHRLHMGVKPGGNLIILGGCGPMGIVATDYALVMENGPKRVVVTDVNQSRIDRVSSMIRPADAAKNGIELIFVNTKDLPDERQYLLDLTKGEGYDDVMVFAPVRSVAETGNRIMAKNGCMNLFAGPVDPNFSADINLYDCHYRGTKIVGSSGGTREDYLEALEVVKKGKINLAHMLTHIGGLDAVIDTTKNVPGIPGGKKLIYTHIRMPLTAIDDFAEKGKTDPLFAKLAEICARHEGLWNPEAEAYLLEHAPSIE